MKSEKSYENVMIWKENGLAEYVKKEYLSRKTGDILSMTQTMDWEEAVNHSQMYVPKYLSVLLKVTGKSLEYICTKRDIIFEARREYIFENSKIMENTFWMRMFLVHDFNAVSKQYFFDREKGLRYCEPDMKRILKQHRWMKEIYCRMLPDKNDADDKIIVLEKSLYKRFPDVYVWDGKRKTEIILHHMVELLKMPIQIRSEEKMSSTSIFFWIYCFMSYPKRMKRYKEISMHEMIYENDLNELAKYII